MVYKQTYIRFLFWKRCGLRGGDILEETTPIRNVSQKNLVLICSDISLLGDKQTEPKRLLLQLNNRLKYPKKIETIHCFISTSCFLASAHLRVRSPESDLMHAAVHQRHQIIACLCTY